MSHLQQHFDLFLFGNRCEGCLSQMTFPLLRLGGQNMTAIGLVSLKFPCTRALKSLFCS